MGARLSQSSQSTQKSCIDWSGPGNGDGGKRNTNLPEKKKNGKGIEDRRKGVVSWQGRKGAMVKTRDKETTAVCWRYSWHIRNEKLLDWEPAYSALRFFNVFIMQTRFWGSAGQTTFKTFASSTLFPRRSSSLFALRPCAHIHALLQDGRWALFVAWASDVKYVSVALEPRKSLGFLTSLKRPGVRVECRWPVIIATDEAITYPTAWARTQIDSRLYPSVL